MHRGATIALAVAQRRSGHDLRPLISFPEGEGAADHEALVEDFDEAADAVAWEVTAEEVIHEAL